MQNIHDVQPIPFCDVTESMVHSAYLSTVNVNSMWSWAEVKATPALYISLQHQASLAPVTNAKAAKKHMLATRPDRAVSNPAPTAPTAHDAGAKKCGGLHLSKSQAEQLRRSIHQARTCLQQSSPGELLINEAMAGLNIAGQLLTPTHRNNR